MLHSLEWEGGNEPDANLSPCYIPWSGEGGNERDANLSLCYIPWSGREGMSQMPISPCVTFLGVEGRELARCQSLPVLHSLESKGGNETDANHSLCYIPWSGREGMRQMPISPCVTFLGVGGRE